MAKKIIILSKENQTNYFELNYLFWLDVPANQQAFRANTDIVSKYTLATAEEIAALRDGSIVEKVGTRSYTNGTSVATIKNDLVSEYNKALAEIAGEVKFNYFGSYWDGASWTIGGV